MKENIDRKEDITIKEDVNNGLNFTLPILTGLILSLFQFEIIVKSLIVVIAFPLCAWLWKKKKYISSKMFNILIFIIIAGSGTAIVWGHLSDNSSNERGVYSLNAVDAINNMQLSDEEYKNMKDKDFIIMEGTLINTESNVEYSSNQIDGQCILFQDIPTGTYDYTINFKNVGIYHSKNPIDISQSSLLIGSQDKDKYAYRYIKIDESKAEYSDWSEWKLSSQKIEPDLLTEVKVKYMVKPLKTDSIVNRNYYKIGDPIIKTEKEPFSKIINENGEEEILYLYVDKVVGYDIVKTTQKYPIYSFQNVSVQYWYRTRNVTNYEDAVEEYYAKYDENDILISQGYIKRDRVIQNND